MPAEFQYGGDTIPLDESRMGQVQPTMPVAAPVGGTGGYITQTGPAVGPDPGTVAEATRRADEAAREANYLRQVEQNTRIQSAAQAVAAARKFMATRKMGMDYQTAIASGLPHEQALALAASRNFDAFGTEHIGQYAQVLKNARIVSTPAPPLGAVSTLKDEEGNVVGHGVRTSTGGMHVVPTRADKESLTAAQRAVVLEKQIGVLQKKWGPNYRPTKQTKPEFDADQALLKEKMSELDALTKPKKSTASTSPSKGVRIRSKADPTKEYNYNGDPKDIPTDKYEIVTQP